MRLYNDVEIPEIAFGTGVIKRYYRNKKLYVKDLIISILVSIKHLKVVRRFKNDYTIKKTIRNAMNCGYKLIDTGRLYGHSEKYIGEVINEKERKNIFIISKVSDVDLKRYDYAPSVEDNLKLSLKFLKTDYLDAYLLHFPQGNWLSMYHDIEIAYKDGIVKSIGVCNFDINELEELIKNSEIKPMICQVEMHPLYTKNELIQYCKKNNIIIMAHTPTGHMNKKIVESPIMKTLIEKYKKNPAQIIYRWHLQKGVIPIISSVSKEHLITNLDIYDFELNDSEIVEIDSLNINYSFDKNNNKMNDKPDFIYNL